MNTITQDQARAIERRARRCTSAVLLALGVSDQGPSPRDGIAVVERLTNAGLRVRVADHDGMTLARFVRENPTGAFFVATSGHAMALVDGVLVDTALEGPNRRRIIGAFEVVR